MTRKRQIVITLFVLGAGMIAIAGFILEENYLQIKTRNKAFFNNSSNEPGISADLFLDFKTDKKDIAEANRNDMHNSGRSLSAGKIVFCWNKKSGNYEKTDINPADIAAAVADNSDNFSKREYADLNRNNIQEEYVLDDGRLAVQENSKILWRSDGNWWVEDFFLADSDNDGIMNLNLSVWKSGNFGKYKPFWVKKNDPNVKNHFFVFALSNNDMKPLWQSSNLPAPNCRVVFSDLDADGKNELVALEGDYAQSPDCRGKYISVWKWNEWGFINEWRSEEGEFSRIEAYDIEGKKCIIGF